MTSVLILHAIHNNYRDLLQLLLITYYNYGGGLVRLQRSHITNEANLMTTDRIDTIVRYSVQAEGITVRSRRPTEPDVPAHQALRIQTDLSTGRKPDVRWRRGHLVDHEKTCCCQIWTDVGISPRNYCDACIYHGHGGVTQRSTQGLRNDDDERSHGHTHMFNLQNESLTLSNRVVP